MKPFAPLQIALLSALCLALPAQAEIYRYKDASGRTVISDQPPPGAAPARSYSGGATPATDDASTAAPAPAPAKSLADRDLEFKKRQQEKREAEEKAKKEAANKAAQKDNCDRARRQLQALESGERITTRDANGERAYLDDAQRAAEIDRARKYLAQTCK